MLSYRTGRVGAVFKPLYATLLTLIAMAETLSHDDLELARVLVAALLNVGVDEQEYRGVVLDLEEVLERQRSLATFDWALDAAEVLAVNPALQEEVRLSFIMKCTGDCCVRWLTGWAVAQMEALRLLCPEDILDLAFRPNCPRRSEKLTQHRRPST